MQRHTPESISKMLATRKRNKAAKRTSKARAAKEAKRHAAHVAAYSPASLPVIETKGDEDASEFAAFMVQAWKIWRNGR